MLHDAHAKCTDSWWTYITKYVWYRYLLDVVRHKHTGCIVPDFPYKLLSTCTPRWPSCAEMPRSYADLGHFSSWMKTLHSTDKSSCMLVEKIMQFLWLLYTPPLKKAKKRGEMPLPSLSPILTKLLWFWFFFFFLTQLWFCRLSCIIERYSLWLQRVSITFSVACSICPHKQSCNPSLLKHPQDESKT